MAGVLERIMDECFIDFYDTFYSTYFLHIDDVILSFFSWSRELRIEDYGEL